MTKNCSKTEFRFKIGLCTTNFGYTPFSVKSFPFSQIKFVKNFFSQLSKLGFKFVKIGLCTRNFGYTPFSVKSFPFSQIKFVKIFFFTIVKIGLQICQNWAMHYKFWVYAVFREELSIFADKICLKTV